MTKLENVENAVTQLSGEDLRAFRDWFADFDANAWDRQIESDFCGGKLDQLAEQALQEYEAGKATDL
jgi:hypothetical protein